MIELKTCSYKGVQFLFKSMPTTGGNRIVKYNYPGSDKQSVEVQGRAPKTFTITAIIPHENYYAQRDNLIKVLEDGTAGVLSHPTFGTIDNVINGIYSLDETITELGRATIEIPFEVDDAQGVPIQSGQLVSQVKAASDTFNSQALSDLDDLFSVDPRNFGNFEDSFENLSNITEAFTAASDFATKITDKAADFTKSLNTFNNNIRSFIRAPLDTKNKFSSAVIGLFDEVGSLFSTPQEAFNSYQLLFDFGNTDAAIKRNTFGRIERAKNRDIVRVTVKSIALSKAYVEAASVEYSTTDDLELVQDILEAQYLDIRENEVITNESLELLDRLRVSAIATLDNARVQTRRVITINTPMRPLSVLLYAYYGNTDLMDTIAEINNIKQNAFVEGDIKILSS